MKTVKLARNISCITLFLFTFSTSNIFGVFGVELANDGGYTVRIAIDNNIGLGAIPDTVAYTRNIKDNLEKFNTQLYNSSRKKFYIKNVELLVPSGWNTTGVAPKEYISDTRTYENADIKISRSESFPYVERAQVCGIAGKYLELPWNFFLEAENSAYGKQWKALTSLWAQYRYGVFEENGYESDARFPYFYRKTETAEWEATGCANAAVKGEYKTPAGEICDPKSPTPMKPLCRFFPANDNTNTEIKSSLMHFHFLDSVTEFCDDSSHNPLSPNRHNALCSSRSVWNVIESTEDYKKVTTEAATPTINFKIIEQAPLFYLLLDQGAVPPGAGPTLARLIPKISSIFDVPDPENSALPPYTLAAIGAYPNPNDAASEVKELVPWLNLGDNEDQFLAALEMSSDGPPQRKFSNALNEVVENIKSRNHAAGGVILHLRTGGGPHTFQHLDSEEQLLAEMRQHRIILNTIELNTTTTFPDIEFQNINLVNLARESGGGFAVLNSSEDLDLVVSHLLSSVIGFVETYSKETSINYESFYNEAIKVESQEKNPVKVNTRTRMRNLRVSFTTLANLTLNTLTFGSNTIDSFKQTNEWMAPDNMYGKKTIYNLQLVNLGNEELPFHFNCTGDSSLCAGHLSAYATYNEENFFAENLNIRVSTSALDNSIDFNTAKEPLSVFATISAGGLPMTNLTVTGTVRDPSTTVFITLDMNDNGAFPDVTANDGIYSVFFIPTRNGPTEVYVEVSNDKQNAKIGSLDYGRILPVDQDFSTGSGKPLVGIIKKRRIELDSQITISNFINFKPYPDTISTLKLSTKEGYSANVNFVPPNIIGSLEADPKIDGYILKRAPSVKELAENFQNTETVLEGSLADSSGVVITADFAVEANKYMYYAMKTTFKNTQSDMSNVVGLRIDSPPSSRSSQLTSIGILTLISITLLGVILSS